MPRRIFVRVMLWLGFVLRGVDCRRCGGYGMLLMPDGKGRECPKCKLEGKILKWRRLWKPKYVPRKLERDIRA
jgi:hypothetical protein